MSGDHRVPVKVAEQPGGRELRHLNEPGSRAVGFREKLEPSLTGDPHLRAKSQSAGGIDRVHPPDVDHVANGERPGVVTVSRSPTHAGAAKPPVDPPAQLPKRIADEPAAVAAECADDAKHRVGGCGHPKGATILEARRRRG